MLIEEITGKKVQIKSKIGNQSAISLIKSGPLTINRRFKHIDIKYRYVSEVVKTDCVNVELFNKWSDRWYILMISEWQARESNWSKLIKAECW